MRQQACPDLVPLVEAGQLDGPDAEAAVNGYLEELLRADPTIDTLLLGCTHYPLLRPLIERRVGPEVAVVDSAFTTALAIEDLLDALGARAPARDAGWQRRPPDCDHRRRGGLQRRGGARLRRAAPRGGGGHRSSAPLDSGR